VSVNLRLYGTAAHAPRGGGCAGGEGGGRRWGGAQVRLSESISKAVREQAPVHTPHGNCKA
jgi:hypothetical protein